MDEDRPAARSLRDAALFRRLTGAVAPIRQGKEEMA
jgi:hypothetical protein